MKKQELIHFHGLLVEIQNYVAKNKGESVDIPEYESLKVSPTAIHKSKGHHKDAVFALADGLSSATVKTSTGAPRAILADD